MERISQMAVPQFQRADSPPSPSSSQDSPDSVTELQPTKGKVLQFPEIRHRPAKHEGTWICCGRAMFYHACDKPWHAVVSCQVRYGTPIMVPDYPAEPSDPFASDSPRESLNGYQRYRLGKNWQRDGLGPRYQNGLWSKCQMAEIIREWHQTPSTGLLISGDKGTGKTVASGLMMTCLAARNEFSFAWCNISTLFSFLHSWRNWGTDFSQDEMLRELRTCKYLFLDDLGVEYNSAMASTRFNELIETRYSRELVTVATSNLTRERLIQREGWERIVDRLQDGILDWCELGGESMRGPR